MNKNSIRTILLIGGILLAGLIVALSISMKTGNWRGILPTRIRRVEPDANSNDTLELISFDEAEGAIRSYLTNFAVGTLGIKEIMIFDNQAYARIIEEDSGIGAFELIVDPVTQFVYHAQGPSLLWNLQYGYMRGGGIDSSVLSGPLINVTENFLEEAGTSINNDYEDGVEMPINAEEAIRIADEYLSRFNNGISIEEQAFPFYGYYTIHTLKNGDLSGMLSVNGYTGQVFLHTWHGEFVGIQSYSGTM
jgi:hypothetical protein